MGSSKLKYFSGKLFMSDTFVYDYVQGERKQGALYSDM